MKGTEARETDSHLERNYIDILLNIHCSEANQIYVRIKCDVPSQISFEGATASDVFSFFRVLLDNLECACSILRGWSAADLRKYNFLSVSIPQPGK